RAEEHEVDGHGEREAPGALAVAPEQVLRDGAEPAGPGALAEVADALVGLLQIGERARVGEISHRHGVELEAAAHAHHGARRGVLAELDRLEIDLAVPEAGEVDTAFRNDRLREIAGLEARIDEVALLELRAPQVAVGEVHLGEVAADEAGVLRGDVAEYRPAQRD